MVIIEIRVTSGARNLLEIGRRDKSAGGQRSTDRKILVRYPCKATEHRLSENGQTSSKRKEAGPLLYFLTRVIMTVFVVTTEISLTYLLTDHTNSSPPFTSTSDPPTPYYNSTVPLSFFHESPPLFPLYSFPPPFRFLLRTFSFLSSYSRHLSPLHTASTLTAPDCNWHFTFLHFPYFSMVLYQS